MIPSAGVVQIAVMQRCSQINLFFHSFDFLPIWSQLIAVRTKSLTARTRRTLWWGATVAATTCRRVSSRAPAKSTSLGSHSTTRNASSNLAVGPTMDFKWVTTSTATFYFFFSPVFNESSRRRNAKGIDSLPRALSCAMSLELQIGIDAHTRIHRLEEEEEEEEGRSSGTKFNYHFLCHCELC